jgi:hypothetical protein
VLVQVLELVVVVLDSEGMLVMRILSWWTVWLTGDGATSGFGSSARGTTAGFGGSGGACAGGGGTGAGAGAGAGEGAGDLIYIGCELGIHE